jgi:hypothetical protein
MFFSAETPAEKIEMKYFLFSFTFYTTYIYALLLFITLFMLYNLHSITEKKPLQTRSVRTPTDRKNSLIKEENLNYQVDGLVTVYPNPATTTVIIAYNKEVDGLFTLFNVLGEKILQTTLSKHNSKTQIPIHDNVSGVYHYEIQFGTEDKVRGKLNIIK